mgnify:FL=1
MSNYAIGDYVMHESAGVCQVAAIKELALQGKGTEKMYYELDPVFQHDSQVITPVDDKMHRLRDVKSADEMESILEDVSELDVIQEKNERVRQEKMKEQIALFDPRPLAGVVKTVYLRKRARLASGKKSMSSDERVLQSAGKKLFEEMAFAMQEDIVMVRDNFCRRLDVLEA